jgi:hypothetical protein
MSKLFSLRIPALIVALNLAAAIWAQENVVEFSGVIGKTNPAENKVFVVDPKSKKRFSVLIDGKSKLTGFSGISDIKKDDKVQGKYAVTPDGKYVATELSKN